MIRACNSKDFDTVWSVTNDGAVVYGGVIPEDRWHEPYMSKTELRHEIDDGVVFWGYEQDGALVAVMGIQELGDVTLIRHAYVCTSAQRRGIGGQLLSYLRKLAKKPLLIGTWADANWAMRFYERHGFNCWSSTRRTGSFKNTGPYLNARSKLPLSLPARNG